MIQKGSVPNCTVLQNDTKGVCPQLYSQQTEETVLYSLEVLTDKTVATLGASEGGARREAVGGIARSA